MNSLGQLVHAKRQDGIDDVSIGFIRNTGGNSVGIEATTQVTDQWGEQRAEFEGSTEADWSITMDGETLSYNGVLTPSVTDFTPPTPIPVEGVVQVFKDNACTEYADGQSRKVYVRVNQNFGEGGYRSWGELSDPQGKQLTIYTPTDIDPQDQYMIAVWEYMRSVSQSTPFTAGDIVECEQDEEHFKPVSNPQVIFE